MSDVIYYILSALAVLIALSVHEYSHGYAAYKMGDDTARNLGRLTLNPIKHIDIIGALCMIFFHVGWAKPVPVNSRNFKNPKRGFAVTALAGPLSNIAVAFITAPIYILLFKLLLSFDGNSEFSFKLLENTLTFVALFFSINIGLGIFNLLPLPPFDGSRIVYAILPEKIYFGIMKYERRIYLAVLLWLVVGDAIKAGLLSVSFIAANPVLSFIAGIFSLSDMLGYAISAISGFILDLWGLIPLFSL